MQEKESAIIQRALEEGLLSRSDLEDCRRTVESLSAVGVKKSLLEVLAEHDHLTEGDLAMLEGEVVAAAEAIGERIEDVPDPVSKAPSGRAQSARASAEASSNLKSVVRHADASARYWPGPKAPRVQDKTIDFDQAELEALLDEPILSDTDFEDEEPEDGFPASAPVSPATLEATEYRPLKNESFEAESLETAPPEDSAPLPAPSAPEIDVALAVGQKDLIGQTVGGCTIEGVLGQGAMGTVFKAQHDALQKTVAVKILNPALFYQPKQVDQFFLEARAAAAIDHTNIVAVHDVGQTGGLYYIVMQYIEGESLADRIEKERRLPPDEAVRIAMEAARGLEVAHDKGIVHRDIKPANLMLTANGQVKIADFGLACRPEEDASMTGGVEVMGTPTYMSPEQIDGRNVDHRADLYALGVTLYYATTGKKPFEGATPMEVLLKHMNEPLVPPTQVNSEIPSTLGLVIQRLLAKSPDRRYPDASELLKDLDKVLHGGRLNSMSTMDESFTGMDAIAKEETGPLKDRRPLTAAIISGIAAATCVILFTVALPDVGITSAHSGSMLADPLLEEAEGRFRAAVELAKSSPSRIHAIRRAFQEIKTEFPGPYQDKAVARLKEYEKLYELSSREAAQEHLSRSVTYRRERDNLNALLALYEIPEEWLAGSVGGEANLLKTRLSLKLRNEIGMTLVPGGAFLSGPEKVEGFLPPFLIDVTEVSNEEYMRFVRETGHRTPPHWVDGGIPGGTEHLPVVGVSYADASEFAAWSDKRLPTTLEWEKAARGKDGRIYPWGDEFDKKRANCNSLDNELRPVNSYRAGKSPYECLNMAGNAFEWTESPSPDSEGMIIRGGAHRSNLANVRTFVTLAVSPDHMDPEQPVGFRCVKDVK